MRRSLSAVDWMGGAAAKCGEATDGRDGRGGVMKQGGGYRGF